MKPTKKKTSLVLLAKMKKKLQGDASKAKKIKIKEKQEKLQSIKQLKQNPIVKKRKQINNGIAMIALTPDTKPMKCPLGSMLSSCNLSTKQMNFSSNIPTFLEKLTRPRNTCSLKTIDCEMPEPIELIEDDYVFDESDLGSLVESASEDEEKPFNKEKVGEYLLYQIPKGAILLLYGSSKVFIHGVMKATVLHGEVEILGKHLDKKSPSAMVFSPRGSAYLSIQNVSNNNKIEENSKKTLKDRLLSLGLDESITREVITYKLKSDTVVLHCENAIDKATEFLEANLLQKIYPKLQNGLRCVFRNYTTQDWNVLQLSPEWPQLVNVFTTNDRMMLCGGKGVGKSTLLRFLVNKLLGPGRDAVYVLDLDPGQPEFTVPGAISIVQVTQPLLGPNYTHLQTPLACVFVPSINISADHETYLECVKALLARLPRNAPVIVNYMGFTKGIGIFLTASIMALVKPSVVVQIESQHDSRNFNVDLTPETIREQVLLHDSVNSAIKSYKLIKIDSVASGATSGWGGWELEPRQVREMCILSYMSQILPRRCRYLTEKGVNIYQTSLDDISIVHNGKPCLPLAANANIVALCLEDAKTCLGWGIVRGYCPRTNRLLLLTPVDAEILGQVKSVVVGSITLPPSIYLRHHDAIRGNVPYTYKGELVNFAKSPKRIILPKQFNNGK